MRNTLRLTLAVGSIALVTAVYTQLGATNATTAALSFLLVILVAAATSRLWIAITASLAAMFCFNFFFLPPLGTLTIADPQNWVALVTFLAVSLVASNLASAVRARAQDAMDRRDELARLLDLSRDVLLMTDSRDANATLARAIARRFDLDYAAICLPRGDEWDVFEAGALRVELERHQLSLAFAGARAGSELDTRMLTYGGERVAGQAEDGVHIVPLRVGTRPIGLLAAARRRVDPGTFQAVAGVVAIAIERVQFLDERKAAELARQSEELKSALLASLGHDLRTPLTAIRVAASNLRSSWASDEDRQVQSELILVEVGRLNRLFQNILDMARLDAGGLSADRRWVHPSELIDAARMQVEHAIGARRVKVRVADDSLVRLDPRLTAAALAHLIENAAQYSPADSPIDLEASVTSEGLMLSVRDHGRGIAAGDLPHLFDRFYRGEEGRHRTSGTGMGLSIARGVLAVERGRVEAENCSDGGARFTMVVPAEVRIASGSEAATG